MPEDKVHPFMAKIKATNQLEYKDNNLYLMGTPAYLFSLNVLVLMQNALKEKYGKDGLSIMYDFLAVQTKLAALMMKNRFGFSAEQGLKMQIGQVQMIGAGKAEFTRMDFEKNHFIIKTKSTFAEEYKKTFGVQKEPIDWFLKGAYTSLVSEYIGREDLVCIETSCITQGKEYCEFVIKPKSEFNLDDPEINNQIPTSRLQINDIINKEAMGMPKRTN